MQRHDMAGWWDAPMSPRALAWLVGALWVAGATLLWWALDNAACASLSDALRFTRC